MSPTFTWAKFLTSGPTASVTTLPRGPFSVTVRAALSIASTEAVILAVFVIVPLPGVVLVTVSAATSGFWANAGTDAAATSVADKMSLRMVFPRMKNGGEQHRF